MQKKLYRACNHAGSLFRYNILLRTPSHAPACEGVLKMNEYKKLLLNSNKK